MDFLLNLATPLIANSSFTLQNFQMLFINEFVMDMLFLFKLITLLAIITFVQQHLGKGVLSIMVIAGLSAVILIDNLFWLFGGLYLIYLLLVMGFSSIIIDFFFVSPAPMPKGPEGGGPEGEPISNGKDFTERQHSFQRLMHPPGRR
jgi:hypothetical protein